MSARPGALSRHWGMALGDRCLLSPAAISLASCQASFGDLEFFTGQHEKREGTS